MFFENAVKVSYGGKAAFFCDFRHCHAASVPQEADGIVCSDIIQIL